jgi:hypothetical protein
MNNKQEIDNKKGPFCGLLTINAAGFACFLYAVKIREAKLKN